MINKPLLSSLRTVTDYSFIRLSCGSVASIECVQARGDICEARFKRFRLEDSIMSSIATELQVRSTRPVTFRPSEENNSQSEIQFNIGEVPPDRAVTVAPDGGYGWVIVFGCSILAFWFSGLTGAWGVIQNALLSSSLQGTPSSTTAFVGSLGITICVAFGLVAVRLMQLVGVRTAAVLGILLLGVGTLTSSFTTTNVAGLFQTYGLVLGIGDCLCYTATNVMPAQYFTRHIGVANGIIKLGGGLGATVLSVSLNSLIDRVGVAWMFRILGYVMLLTGIPAALALKQRTPQPLSPILDVALFKSIPFSAVFIAGATATFTLFIPPFFLPLFAESIGLSSNVGAGLVAGFNACTTIGRFIAGPLCDRMGPLNTFVVVGALNAITIFAIWPVSSTFAPLILFVILNGIANGAFFTTFPIVVSSMVDPGRAVVAMSMSITGWTGGYLMGPPIAGYISETNRTANARISGASLYRSAIFYAGGLASLSSVCVFLARFLLTRKVLKKV